MAKKEEPKKTLERVYNVPLRREYLKVANWRRTQKAVKALREFIAKHMKSEDVVIGKYANQFLWKHGIKNPPHHIKVNAVKDESGRVVVELVELSARDKRDMEKYKEASTEKDDKAKEKKLEAKKVIDIKAEKVEEKAEEAKKEKEEKAKEIQKEELKELHKEHPKGHQPHGHSAQLKQKQDMEKRPTAPKSV